MNPSTAMATVLVDELIRNGVTDAVLSPGSRNAPLSFALSAADRAGRLRLHVRIDERSAGFLALGLAKRSGRPVPVSCTSGTAAANLHPAVLEASHAGVPLLLLTADRPPELRDTGASQTVDQLGMFGTAVRFFHEFGAPETRAGQNAYWRETVCRAVYLSGARYLGGPAVGWPGPVHLNVPLRDPLVPNGDAGDDWPESLTGRAGAQPWTVPPPGRMYSADRPLELPGRTVVVAGDSPSPLGARAASFARGYGLPLISEPTSAAWGDSLAAGFWLLGDDDLVDTLRPDHVVVVGRPTLGRALSRLVMRPGVQVTAVEPNPRWPDPYHIAAAIRAEFAGISVPDPDPDWLPAWAEADKAAAEAVARIIDERWSSDATPPGGRIARDMLAALPANALLFVGSSNPIRDVDYFGARRSDLTILTNRGVAGIDGNVSAAIGAALARQADEPGTPAYALMGDLTFLHDSNGLILGPDEPRPDLVIVVANDDGGAIFSLLEQGDERYAADFERIFGTSHGTDVGALCAASGIDHVRVRRPGELPAALAPGHGIRVVEVPANRTGNRSMHAEVRSAVQAATAPIVAHSR